MTEINNIDKQVRYFQVDQLYSRMPVTAKLSLAAATLLVILLWPFINHLVLVGWWIITVLIYSLRWFLVHRYQLATPQPGAIENWATRFLAGTIGGGLTWGAAFFLLFPENDLDHQLLLLFIVAGMASMAVTTLSPVKINIIVFLCLLLIPAFLRLFLTGGRIHLVMSAFVLLYLIATLFTSIYIHKTYLANLSLRINSMIQAEKLQESQERYQDIFENATDLIQSLAPDGRFLYVNRAWYERLGYNEKELAGMTFLQIVHPHSQAHCSTLFQNLLEGKEPGKIEATFVTKSGEEVLVEGSVSCRLKNGRPISIRGIFRDITIRKRSEEKIIAALREKEMLLKEIHHRVKNNLQTIISLLNLQARAIEDRQALEVFERSRERVRALALIHEKLCESVDSARIDFRVYVKSLTSYLCYSHSVHPGQVKLKTKIEDIALDMDTAMPLGLIINELVTNSLEHAFPGGRKGELYIELRKNREDQEIQEVEIGMDSEDEPESEICSEAAEPGEVAEEAKARFTLLVKDDGVGLPGDLDLSNAQSLGMLLVYSLVKQLRGVIETKKEQGTAFIIKFNKLKYKKKI